MYYNSSILHPDGFLGYPCSSYEEFQQVGHSRTPETSLVALLVMFVSVT